MRRGLPSTGLAAALALASWASGCADPVEQRAATAPVTVELVTVEQGLHDAWATYKVRNMSNHALAFLGYSDGVPVSRLTIQSEGEWVERTPAWMGCGTGQSLSTLESGAETTLKVRAQRSDLPMRVGVGTWALDETPVGWMEWNWTWSDAMVVDDRLNLSDS